MKGRIIILLLLINIVYNADFIRKMIKNIAARCPEMKRALEKDPGFRSSELRPIVGRGFTYYNQRLEGTFYGGVMVDTMTAFLNDVADDMKFESNSYKKKFVDLFELSQFSGSNFVLMPRILFKSKNPTSQGRFFVGFSEKRKDNCVDFLFLNIKTTFTLAKDVFLATQGKSNLFWGHTKQVLIERPRFLTMDQAEKLFTFFQISMFESAQKILNYVKAIG